MSCDRTDKRRLGQCLPVVGLMEAVSSTIVSNRRDKKRRR